MYNYGYKAVNSSGKIIKGEFCAINEEELEKNLHANGETLIKAKKIENKGGISAFFSRKVKPRLLAEFYLRISDSLRLGLPIVSILNENAKSLPAPLNRICEKLKASIESGGSFSSAAAQFPDTFGKMDIGLIKLGETSGQLPGVMKELSEFIEWRENIKSIVKKATIYPTFIFIVIAAVVAIWVGVVIPNIAELILSLGIDLPTVTVVILKISDFSKSHYIEIFSAIFIFFALFFIFCKTKKGRLLFDLYLLRVPVIGKLVLNITMARMSNNFATMYGSGMMLNSIFELLIDKALGNRYIESRLNVVFKEIEKGNLISAGFETAGTFPQFFIGTIQNGENTGDLDGAFRRLGKYYNDHVKRVVDNLIAALEPFTLIVLGAVFGLIVVSIMLPLYDMLNEVSGKF